jgi:excisionase family DNA binding protein
MASKRDKRRARHAAAPVRNSEILDVHKVAALLTVSADTVYELLKSGELPGRKVGRKWITTKGAVMRWLEGSSAGAAAQRAIEVGDRAALAKALQNGRVRLKSVA